MNLAKFRKVQKDLEQAEERAETAENALAKMRTTGRNSVSASRVTLSPQRFYKHFLSLKPKFHLARHDTTR